MRVPFIEDLSSCALIEQIKSLIEIGKTRFPVKSARNMSESVADRHSEIWWCKPSLAV